MKFPENAMNPFVLPLALALSLSTQAHALYLAPQHTGLYLDGDGANSRWVQVEKKWRGSIHGDEKWGTGIWGLADHDLVMGLNQGDPKVKRILETVVDEINFADQWFIEEWSASWGTAELAPLFHGEGQGARAQDNWASSFWGYLAIPEAGEYNFGVLFDDGFRFTLMGADGSRSQIYQDGLNPRERLGFSSDLLLDPGLYAFQLDAYERLEAGVVQLSWWTPSASEWSVIPTSSLYTGLPAWNATPSVRAVPEPPVPLLLMAGLAAFGLAAHKRWQTRS
jgi:hypothetical protein